MAWYYGTYSCGHEGRVNIVGPGRDRPRKAEYAFSKPCPDCYEKERLEKRRKQNEEAEKISEEWELPVLSGTEKQIAWANTLRVSIINEIDSFRSTDLDIKGFYRDCYTFSEIYNRKDMKDFLDGFDNDPSEVIDRLESFIISQEKASWFIDRRNNRDWLSDGLIGMISFSPIPDQLVEINTEIALSPEENKFPGMVEISNAKKNLIAKYEKNDKFREIVKECRLTWNGSCWCRELSNTTGSYSDRAAELANKLLRNGFTVSMQDEDARRMAVDGSFDPEHTRWVYYQKGTNRFAIRWPRTNTREIYTNARKIPGSRYDGDVTVPVSYYAEVQDFADMYGFRFTEAAQKAIESYINEFEQIEKVVPADAPESPNTDKLHNILQSSGAIIDDLRDGE